jgi:hypothetical protein
MFPDNEARRATKGNGDERLRHRGLGRSGQSEFIAHGIEMALDAEEAKA